MQDMRFAIRMLLKNPGFTIVAVLALALGIGANSAIFSVINAVVLRPLSYHDPDKLVLVSETYNRGESRSDNLPASPANFADWREQNQVFENMGAFVNNNFNLTGDGEPERLRGTFASASAFQLLGVKPLHGRVYGPEEDSPGNKVAVLSQRLWQRRFNSDPGIIEKQITLNNESYTVIGVMPESFRSITRIPTGITLMDSDLWVPLFSFDARFNANRSLHLLAVIARLKPDVTIEQAQTDMSRIASSLEQQYANTNTGNGVKLYSVHEQLVGNIKTTLWVLLGAVGFVLLIACANVANLLLARSRARQKEIAIRMALGATRSRLVRQLLTESLLLALLGGIAAMLLALWGVDLLVALGPGDIPRVRQIGLDGRVAGFTLAIALLTGLIFGLAPALGGSKPDLNETLKEGGRGSFEGFRRFSLRNILVVTETAMALVLLIGAGLMIRSFLYLQQVNPGFNTENVLSMEIALSATKHGKPEQQVKFFEQALDRIKHLPGVRAAAATNALPLTHDLRANGFTIEGRPASAQQDTLSALVRIASPDYFQAMSIPISRGRAFTDQDRAGAPDVMMINETFAFRYFPDEDPIGKRVTSARMALLGGEPITREIVGVVSDIKHYGLDTETKPEMFFPSQQDAWPGMYLVVRTDSDPASITAAVRNAIWTVDQDQPINDVKTMDERLAESVSQRRFNTLLLIVFAGVALILAGVGIYGVISYSVTQRTHEIGIRMALGASSRDVLRMIVGHAMMLAFAGVAAGAAAAYGLTRLMRSLLYEVSATDTATFIVISSLLIGVALVASYLPARRATKVDPMIALRCE